MTVDWFYHLQLAFTFAFDCTMRVLGPCLICLAHGEFLKGREGGEELGFG